MALRRLIKWVKYIIGAFVVITTVYGTHVPKARADVGLQQPSVFAQSSGDVTQADSAVSSSVHTGLYIAYGLEALAFVISIIMCIPFIGHTAEGIKGMKITFILIVLTGAFNLIIAYGGKLIHGG